MLFLPESMNKVKKDCGNNYLFVPDCVCDKLLCHSNINYLEGYLDAIFDVMG